MGKKVFSKKICNNPVARAKLEGQKNKTSDLNVHRKFMSIDLGTFQYLLKMSAIEESQQRNILDIEDEVLIQLLDHETSELNSMPNSRNDKSYKRAENQHKLDKESNTARMNNLSLE